MADGSDGYRAARVRRQLMPGLISSSPVTAGLPPFISFLTSCPELGPAVPRPKCRLATAGAAGARGAKPPWTFAREGALVVGCGLYSGEEKGYIDYPALSSSNVGLERVAVSVGQVIGNRGRQQA